MIWQQTRAQTSIELALGVAIAIVLATIVGLILKQSFMTVQNDALVQVNAVVSNTN